MMLPQALHGPHACLPVSLPPEPSPQPHKNGLGYVDPRDCFNDPQVKNTFYSFMETFALFIPLAHVYVVEFLKTI